MISEKRKALSGQAAAFGTNSGMPAYEHVIT